MHTQVTLEYDVWWSVEVQLGDGPLDISLIVLVTKIIAWIHEAYLHVYELNA